MAKGHRSCFEHHRLPEEPALTDWMSLFGIFFGSFVSEDVTLAVSVTLLAHGKLNLFSVWLANFLGISFGDLALYWFGRLLRASKGLRGWLESRFNYRPPTQELKDSTRKVYDVAIFVSRVVPGTRIPTYVSAGYFHYPHLRFVLLTLVSVAGWVCIALFSALGLLKIFGGSTIWVFVTALGMFFLCRSGVLWLLDLRDPWLRKALMYRWRRWLHFEFWPSLVFYTPVFLYYFYLGLRYRSFFLPVFSNPGIKHGGFIGESKWEFYQHLNEKDVAQALRVDRLPDDLESREQLILQLIERGEQRWPLILKPDVGQRGFAVRLVANIEEARDYFRVAPFPILAQEYCEWTNEVGVFYVRDPEKTEGSLFSVTQKILPNVEGDGTTPLGDLILRDKRARIIAATYFKRHEKDLGRILKLGESKILVKCGNHCQGAIFLDGAHLISPRLTNHIDQIAKRIPEFYFGRFDLKYENVDELSRGNFKVIEVNGAGSEATHIWDSKMSLREAYATLFNQWRILFEISAKNYKRGRGSFHRLQIVREVISLALRKGPLETSS